MSQHSDAQLMSHYMRQAMRSKDKRGWHQNQLALYRALCNTGTEENLANAHGSSGPARGGSNCSKGEAMKLDEVLSDLSACVSFTYQDYDSDSVRETVIAYGRAQRERAAKVCEAINAAFLDGIAAQESSAEDAAVTCAISNSVDAIAAAIRAIPDEEQA